MAFNLSDENIINILDRVRDQMDQESYNKLCCILSKIFYTKKTINKKLNSYGLKYTLESYMNANGIISKYIHTYLNKGGKSERSSKENQNEAIKKMHSIYSTKATPHAKGQFTIPLKDADGDTADKVIDALVIMLKP